MAVKGLGAQLTRKAPARHSGIVAAMQQAPAGEVVQVAFDDIASNPANPTAREHDDLTELAASIREVGIVQALTLVPAADWLRHHPEHTEAVGERPYVALAGHRRRAAAVLAGETHGPAMIRPELADTGATDIQLHENLHRLALTPLQEALAYRAKVDQGYSQRQIAAAVKVSQGQIAKRLSLLKLPESVQTAVDQGWYTVADALQLLQLDPEVVDEVAVRVVNLTNPANMTAREAAEDEYDLNAAEIRARRATDARNSHDLGLAAITREAEREVQRRRREQEAQAKAEELGATFVPDPSQKFRGRQYDHELVSQKDIQRHAKNGNLAVSTGYGGIHYYALAKDNKRQQVSDAEQAQRDEEQRTKRARRESHKARVAALVSIAAQKPSASALREYLVHHVLDAPIYDADAKKLALKIAAQAGVGPTDINEYYYWMQAVTAETEPAKREQIAWILVWAAREKQHQYDTNYSPWDGRDLRYFDDLIKLTGYTPSEWEQEQLAKARAREAERAQTTEGDQEGTDQ